MENKKTTRYDYFLIWGNGLEHTEAVVNTIRQHGSFEIVKIHEHSVNDMKKFVKEVYSHDYAPYHHLKGKTKYLLSTTPKVLFIFVKNNNINEAYFGENEHRHIESITVKKLKESIRDTHNERKNERRTENHMIHASDNENQTDYILKYLGYPEGISLFEPYSDIISFSGLNTKGVYTIKKIPTDKLFSSIVNDAVNKPNIITTIEKSPQYRYLAGEKNYYEKYIEKFKGTYLQDDHSIEKYNTLIKSFEYLDKDHPTNYIMVKNLDEGKYLILDGLHRAAVLKYKGFSHIISAIIQ